MSIKRTVMFMLIGVMLFAFSTIVYAGNDNIPYSFTLRPAQGVDSSSTKYRQTSNYRNAWKVNMTYNSEGTGTKATYWLMYGLDARLSNEKTIKQGSGAHYYPIEKNKALSVKKYVYLRAQNNNFNYKFETVAGYWDEETGKSV